MIQILVCDKVYVTPEMRRKKRLYKFYFILSVFLLISLCSYYIYAEYDRNKSEQISHEILENINMNISTNIGESVRNENIGVTVNGDVIVVVLDDQTTEEINVDDILRVAQEQITDNESSHVNKPIEYTAKDGTVYSIIGTISVPKLNIQYPILSTWSDELLKNATCKFAGPDPNEVGNFCIIGHNYRNSLFFSKLETLQKWDIIEIQDTSGRTMEYIVYDKYVVDPNDISCADQKTDGKKEITLITCYNNGTQRTIIKAIER